MVMPINQSDSAACAHQQKASSGIGLVVRLILFVIVVIWFVVGTIVYIMLMTSTHE
jgi:hypothetical protein